MERGRPWDVVLGTALLGVLGTAAIVTAVLFGFAAWAIEGDGYRWEVGSTAMVVIAGLLVVYAGVTLVAAWAEWTGRAVGRPLGIGVALVGVLAAIVALVQNQADQSVPLLALAIVVAALTTVVQLVPARPARAG